VHNVTLAAVAAIMFSIVRSTGGYKQLFPIPETPSVLISMHDKAPSVVSVGICNKDGLPIGIDG
jgi:hypothetical protein